MANIRVDLTHTIYDGEEVKFRSPVDCSKITGLIIYYPEYGSQTSKTFEFTDAHGHNVGDVDHLFSSDVVVKVVLDMTTSKAYVQNADTNAYLEARLYERSISHIVGKTIDRDSSLPTYGLE